MRYGRPATPNVFRRAVTLSVSLHLVVVAVAALCLWKPWEPPGSAPGSDVVAVRDAAVKLDSEDEPPPEPQEPPRIELPNPPTPIEPVETGHPPTLTQIPRALTPELLAVVRRARETSTASETTDPGLLPASAVSTPLISPLHGAMKPGQTVVYILDCSGSMGEFGKLALARSTLLATLQRQPEGVRFQIIPYNSNARLLLPGGYASMTANLAPVEGLLAKLVAAGRSNHTDALRVAIGLRPEAIVWLTDADDLSATKLKPVLNGAGKPTPVYVAEVSARGVGSPKELR
jgi:hypothetical protein